MHRTDLHTSMVGATVRVIDDAQTWEIASLFVVHFFYNVNTKDYLVLFWVDIGAPQWMFVLNRSVWKQFQTMK